MPKCWHKSLIARGISESERSPIWEGNLPFRIPEKGSRCPSRNSRQQWLATEIDFLIKSAVWFLPSVVVGCRAPLVSAATRSSWKGATASLQFTKEIARRKGETVCFAGITELDLKSQVDVRRLQPHLASTFRNKNALDHRHQHVGQLHNSYVIVQHQVQTEVMSALCRGILLEIRKHAHQLGDGEIFINHDTAVCNRCI